MNLDISEYMDSSHGNPIEPPVAHQVVALGSEPARSRPFHKHTVLVVVVADVNCRVGFGTDPEATSLLHAGREMTRVIHPGSGFRLCAMPAEPETQMGGVVDSLTNAAGFFELLSNPTKGKALLDKLIKARDEAQAASAALGDLKSKEATFAKEKDAFAILVSSTQSRLQEDRHQIEAQREQLEAEKRDLAVGVADLAQDRARFEQIRTEYEGRLADMERLRKAIAA